jgi:hypothetical protein
LQNEKADAELVVFKVNYSASNNPDGNVNDAEVM